jgi:hypothetical protein
LQLQQELRSSGSGGGGPGGGQGGIEDLEPAAPVPTPVASASDSEELGPGSASPMQQNPRDSPKQRLWFLTEPAAAAPFAPVPLLCGHNQPDLTSASSFATPPTPERILDGAASSGAGFATPMLDSPRSQSQQGQPQQNWQAVLGDGRTLRTRRIVPPTPPSTDPEPGSASSRDHDRLSWSLPPTPSSTDPGPGSASPTLP